MLTDPNLIANQLRPMQQSPQMVRLFHKLVCRVIGHTKLQEPMVFFRSWNNLHEIGSLHCRRCGAMLGEYKKNLAEPL